MQQCCASAVLAPRPTQAHVSDEALDRALRPFYLLPSPTQEKDKVRVVVMLEVVVPVYLRGGVLWMCVQPCCGNAARSCNPVIPPCRAEASLKHKHLYCTPTRFV